jgi:hypothetical protein
MPTAAYRLPARSTIRHRHEEQHMHTTPVHRIAMTAVCITLASASSGCGSDERDAATPPTEAADATTTDTRTAATTAPQTTSPTSTTITIVAATTPPTSTIASVDETWRDAAVGMCERLTAAMFAITGPTSPGDSARFVEDHGPAREELVASTADLDLPPELMEGATDVPALVSTADQWMTRALEQLAADNVDGSEFSETAFGSIDHFRLTLAEIATVFAVAGVPCGLADPARAADADLNVPIPAAWQVSSGFDSIWVSDRANNQIHRIDTDTGEVAAVIDVGSTPFRLQPADGRMIVRTQDAYEFIDPATNTVVETLPKLDVGPEANRAWAVDGALWICDGSRLHRYDPATLKSITTIDLGFTCGNVHATDELVIPWSFNEQPGESGTSVAAFVDPKSNTVRATIDLPVDVGKPTVVNDVVYFPPTEGSTSVVVDQATAAITSTPDLGRPFVHSNDSAFDGTSLYVMVDGRDVAVVDPTNFEVVDTIEPMDFNPPLGIQINALALSPGALWVVNDEASILQRFDLH